MKNAPHNTKLLLSHLDPHPMNANKMPDGYQDKLKAHIAASNNYPPLIVRKHPADGRRYQIIDGANRAAALAQLGHQYAWCQVWDASDNETLILLQTLNRLEGQDDPYLKGNLLRELAREFEVTLLAEQLPLDAAKIRKYIQAADLPPTPTGPEDPAGMIHALTIFVTAEQRSVILGDLATFDKDRGRALLQALTYARACRAQADDKPIQSTPGPASANDD